MADKNVGLGGSTKVTCLRRYLRCAERNGDVAWAHDCPRL